MNTNTVAATNSGPPFSDEVRLLVGPFRVYRELRARPDEQPLRTIASRVARTQLLIAGTVALITAGRLPIHLVVGTAVFWSMVPVLQALMILGGHAVSNRRMPRARAIGRLELFGGLAPALHQRLARDLRVTPFATGEAVTPVSISFAALVGGQPFACGMTYESIGTPPVTVCRWGT